MKKFNIIAAIHASTRGIGINGKLPWHLPHDLQRFKTITTGSTVIMGRKTWQSLPKLNGLPGRQNIVITRTPDIYATDNPTVLFVSSLDAALKAADRYKIFIIGGGDIYKEAIGRRDCEKMYLTLVPDPVPDISHPVQEFDAFFPEYTNDWIRLPDDQSGDQPEDCLFTEWAPINRNAEEEQYQQTMEEILRNPGSLSSNRTGIDTLVKFGATFRFNLRGGRFPLQTTRRMWFRGLFEEFRWMMSGDTNANNLAARGVDIWLPNTTREFLDQRGLSHYSPGDIGPTYGFNLRHYGAEYVGMNQNYDGQGVDQLQLAIDQLRQSPDSRRIIIDLWDPKSVDKTALPPCMFLYTFWYNKSNNELNLHVNQRSSDFFIARNWNDSFAAFFLICISKIVGMEPGELVVTVTNAHIYTNHLEQVCEQLKRKPYPFPTLEITKPLNTINDILCLDFAKDIKLVNYQAHPGIKADMVA